MAYLTGKKAQEAAPSRCPWAFFPVWCKGGPGGNEKVPHSMHDQGPLCWAQKPQAKFALRLHLPWVAPCQCPSAAGTLGQAGPWETSTDGQLWLEDSQQPCQTFHRMQTCFRRSPPSPLPRLLPSLGVRLDSPSDLARLAFLSSP